MMDRIGLDDPLFAVSREGGFRMADHPRETKGELKKKDLKALLDKDRDRISELQDLLYSSGTHAVLLVFQAMDAAGKDSCIRHVMSGVNPQGVEVTSFKAPSTLERSHDFLWRHALALPPKGFIGIHNRSHYEEVLVTRVHPEFILGQNIPSIDTVKDIKPSFWEDRFRSIRSFEQHMADSGTVIMKFFLHMGRDQQKERFLHRIDNPAKNWKFSENDVKERKHWDRYMKVYEEAINATAAPHAPWYIIPADVQWQSRALVGHLLRLRLEMLGLERPVLDAKALAGLEVARAGLMAE